MSKNKLIHTTPSLVVGCVLSWLRQQASLDQKFMAQFLGITQASWSRIENGHATANIEQIISSCKALKVEFVYFAQLYAHICNQLKDKSIIVSHATGANYENSVEIRNVVKQTIAEHALSVSNKGA